ncbi:TPA: helix-turn-helix domain-containing protein [Clostridium perfringens]|uniref:helix-turn-helix domain-containing protein n=1 Tax=Clostridium perfringens TaxID=1502 RepID=UPI002977F187|nr:helix-turn-helix transcriptional regulator [Clostridium perfringens]MDM0987480.1 helix-turn-helix transcriptional regulator [Clostridium perfringens]
MKLKLKELLEQENKSVYWLKHETNISHATIYKMVNNETTMISFDNIEKICMALNCTPNDVFELTK